MSTQFITKFLRGSIRGNMANIVTKGANVAGDAYIKVVQDWKGIRTEQQSMFTEFVGFATAYPELLGDAIVDKVNNYDSPSDSEYVVEIDASIAQTAVDTITNIDKFASTCDGIPNGQGFSIVDGKGYVYTLIPNVRSNGLKGIATTYNPLDYRDYWIYQDLDGRWKCNTILKSVGFYRIGDRSPYPADDRAMVLAIGDYSEFSSSSDNIFGTIRDFCIQALGSCSANTIMGVLTEFCAGVHTTRAPLNISDGLEMLYLHYRNAWQPVNYGVKTYFGDILRQLVVSSEYNDVLLSIANVLVSGGATFDKINAALSRWTTSTCAVIKQFIQGATDAFLAGGFYGLLMWFIDIIKGESSVQVADGRLEFTDNKSLVPAQYIATAICTIIGAVGSAVAMIVTCIQPVIGAILGLLSSVVGFIPQAWNYDYTKNTLASINTAECYKLLCSPLAMAQWSFWRHEIPDIASIIDEMIEQSGSLVYFDVPGGILLLGRGEYTGEYRVEFHPAGLIFNKSDYIDEHFMLEIQNFERDYIDHYRLIIDTTQWTVKTVEDLWVNLYEHADLLENTDNLNDNGGNILSSENDDKLRVSTAFCISLFYMWISLQDSTFNSEFHDNRYLGWELSRGSSDLTHPGWDFDVTKINNFTNMLAASLYDIKTNYEHGDLYRDSRKEPSWNQLANLCYNDSEVTGFGTDAYIMTKSGDSWVTGTTILMGINDYTPLAADIVNTRHFFGDGHMLPITYQWLVGIPKFDRSSFLTWCIITTLIVAAATTVTIVAAVGIKKWKQKKRAKLTSDVSNSWENYTRSMKDYDPSDPDDNPALHTDAARKTAYNKYYKSVKKNNRWSAIVGGSKYSTAGYWDSDGGDSVDAETLSYPTIFAGQTYDEASQDMAALPNADLNTDNYPDLNLVLKVLKG